MNESLARLSRLEIQELGRSNSQILLQRIMAYAGNLLLNKHVEIDAKTREIFMTAYEDYTLTRKLRPDLVKGFPDPQMIDSAYEIFTNTKYS